MSFDSAYGGAAALDASAAATARPGNTLRLTVLVPTYRRPADLERCLTAIAAQVRKADQVLVVCREDDALSLAVLNGAFGSVVTQTVHLREPGVVAALNAGLAYVDGDVVVFTDDDAAPHADWLARIEQHYLADPTIGGLGGRDHVPAAATHPQTERVGIITWFGRQIGNHHLGTGAPRYVSMLKGVNMSFRTSAIRDVRFDERLRGTGAQVHNELAFSLAVRKRGWHLLYDPAVAVDHFPAQRFDEDQRSAATRLATSNSAYNESLTLLENLPRLAVPFYLIWAFAIGPRELPGVVQTLRLALVRDPASRRFPAVVHGRLAAIATCLSGRTAAAKA